MNFTAIVAGIGTTIVAISVQLFSKPLTESLPEFFDRNPNCLPEDVESYQNLVSSAFKKSESYRMVLIAVAGTYFIHRLCFELGRILIDAQLAAREKK